MSVTNLRGAIHVVEDDVFGFASMFDFDVGTDVSTRDRAVLKAHVSYRPRWGGARARAAMLAQVEEKDGLRTLRVSGREVFVDEDGVFWELFAVTGGAMDETG